MKHLKYRNPGGIYKLKDAGYTRLIKIIKPKVLGSSLYYVGFILTSVDDDTKPYIPFAISVNKISRNEETLV